VHFDPDATMVAGADMAAPRPVDTYVPPAEQPAPVPAYAEPAYAEPAYASPVPPGPVEDYPAPPAKKSSSRRTWILAGCGCLLICLCLVAVGAYIFDLNNMYCTPPFDAIFPCP
jgi:hypothetical protein